MVDDRPLQSMASLRDVLNEIDKHIDRERLEDGNVCPRCLNTNTEVIRNERGHAIGARRCHHER